MRYVKRLSRISLIMALFMPVMSSSAVGQEIIIIPDTSEYEPLPEGLNTNLLIATYNGYNSEIRRLMNMGADIDTRTVENATPLLLATSFNNIQTVKTILEYDPDPDLFSNMSETALLIAAKNGFPQIAEELIRYGANVDLADMFGAAPIHYSAIYGDLVFTDMLIYYGANINLQDNDGTTPLMSAVWSASADVADLLIQNNANVNSTDNKGFTPLMIAIQNNDTLIADILLRRGANLYSTNIYKYNALDIAIRNGDTLSVNWLLSRISVSKISDSDAINPLLVARQYGRPNILALLEKTGFKTGKGVRVDRAIFSTYYKGLSNDTYFGGSLGFGESLHGWYLITGFEFKPTYSRILIKETENLYYQYFDQRFTAYAGAGRKFRLTEHYIKGDLGLAVEMKAGYMFAKYYKGTYKQPDAAFRIMPAAYLTWSKRNLNLYAGYEYTSTDLYRNGPHWFKLGAAYNLFFNDKSGPLKVIKWY